MKAIVLFFSLFAFFMPSFSYGSPSLSQGCFDSGLEKHDLTMAGEKIGIVSVKSICWDNNPDSNNRSKNLSGGVSFLLCLPDLRPCKKGGSEKDVAYMTFLVPIEEFVTKASSGYGEDKTLVESGSKLDVYAGKEKDALYYVSKTSDTFNVFCLASEYGSCRMMGLAEGKIQYFLHTSYQKEGQDWQSLHEIVTDFIGNAVSFE